MRFFNTAGPIDPGRHYFLAHRLDEKKLKQLIEEQKYFILHAPRQSGKTTGILNLVQKLNEVGKYQALYVNVEPAQVSRSDVHRGLTVILRELGEWAKLQLKTDDPIFGCLKQSLENVQDNSLKEFLQSWCSLSDKPIILFIDEIDSLVGDTLISVLRQLRAGYPNRPKNFPQALCLIGVRDVRDYRIWSEQQNNMVLGGSAFNIKAESLTLPNFSFDQVADLYAQHMHETGQVFTQEAIQYAFDQTQGQPWLVNALAYQACFREVLDRTQAITLEVMEHSRETLILRRDTHLDVLIDRLQEPRVLEIIDSILCGSGDESDLKIDDLQYVRDLGLVSSHGLKISNPIYQEVIPRELVYTKQQTIQQETLWYLRPDGSLDVNKLLTAFTDFYRENSEIWLEKFAYKESGPHLLLMAFLQRVINGGGKLYREYALGRQRVDLLLSFKTQRIVIELKIKRGDKALQEGLVQTADYMDKNHATEGHLVIFDRSKDKSWNDKIFTRTEKIKDQVIQIWGL